MRSGGCISIPVALAFPCESPCRSVSLCVSVAPQVALTREVVEEGNQHAEMLAEVILMEEASEGGSVS
eukprot:6842276-Heterocapsa_arctica.AAC.1